MEEYLLITVVENRVEAVESIVTDSVEGRLEDMLRAYAGKHEQDEIVEDLDNGDKSGADWGVRAHPYEDGWYYAFSYLSENMDIFAIPVKSIRRE